MKPGMASERGAFEIRPRRKEDVAEAARVLAAVHATDGYPVEGVEDPEAWLETPDLIQAWVAVTEGRIVGHIGVGRPNHDQAALQWIRQTGCPESQAVVATRLFVVPERRGLGIGRKLLEEIATYAEREDVRLVFEVMTKDTKAIRIYERMGCQEFGRVVHHYGQDQKTDAICYVWPPD